MDLSWRHDFWFRRLPRSPRDEGRVEGVVVRPPGAESGVRETPERVQVEPDTGMECDRWSTDDDRTPGSQVSLINVHVLRSIAGDLERGALSGDNLQVDLDLSEENLPPGTRLAIGSAVLEVSEDIHRPCRKFHQRFGVLAAKRVARANRTGLRGRGVLCHVVSAGRLGVGDAIRVERT